MGYASPQKVGYDVYLPSDNTLQKNTTEYTIGAGTYVTVATGQWLEDTGDGSSIRWKCDIKQTGGGFGHVLLGIGGIAIKEFLENNPAYQSHSYDAPITWKRGDYIIIRLCQIGGTTVSAKNFEFAGIKSPVKLD